MDQHVRKFHQTMNAAAKWVLRDEWLCADVQQRVHASTAGYAAKLLELQAMPVRDKAARRAAVYQLLRSPAARLCSVLTAARKKKRRMTWAAVKALARDLDAWRGSSEPVRVKLKLKSSGALRPTLIFAVEATALQLLVVSAVQAQHALPDWEYSAMGKGSSAGVTRTVNLMNDHDLRWVTVFDVKNFFPSITPAGLPKLLGLPHSVIINSLFIAEGTALELGHHSLSPPQLSTMINLIRKGLPQGSCSSPYVASLVHATLTEVVPDTSLATTYVDDGIVAGDKEGVLATKHALQLRASALPTGPVELKPCAASKVTKKRGVFYTGYLIIEGLEGKVRAVPDPASFRRYERRTLRALMNVPFKQMGSTSITHMRSFVAAYPAWDLNDDAALKLDSGRMMLVQAAVTRRQNLAKQPTAPDGSPSLLQQLQLKHLAKLKLAA